MNTEAKVIPLQQLYLSIIVQAANSDRLDVLQQDIDQATGRLWLVSTGTTIPVAHLAYKFELDSVAFAVETRDERKLGRIVKYAEGLDAFVEELQKFLRANRLAHKPVKSRPLNVVP